MKIHHIGYVVKEINKSIQEFTNLGYNLMSQIIDKNRNISIVFMKNENYVIELISPINHKSPVEKILNKSGPTPYHICYKCENIEEKILELKQKGWILIKKKEKAIAIENNYVAFLYHKDLGMIELVEIIEKENKNEEVYI